MRIALTEYEAKHLILKAMGLESELLSRSNLYFLKTDHEVIILDTAKEEFVDTTTTGNPPPQPIPDSCYTVDGISNIGDIDYELEQAGSKLEEGSGES